MYRIKLLCGAVAALCVTSAAGAAQDYPTRPVRMIVPFAAGGPTDVIARVVAQKLTEGLGQQVVVDNRAGAGGNLGMGLAATAPADGHTLIVVSSSFVVNPGLYSSIPYDPYKSFIPVSNMAASPNVFTVHPGIAARNMKELLTVVAADPKKFSVATPGVGTTPDLSAQLLKLTTKLDFVTVPFGGAGPAVASVVSNQTPIGCTALPPTTQHILGGRLRGIAVTTEKRLKALPDLPAIGETVPGYEVSAWFGLFGPAKLPPAIVEQLYKEAAKAVTEPTLAAKMEAGGTETVGNPTREFTQQAKAEYEKWRNLVKKANLKLEN